jgi:hypothetical protein
VVQELDEKSMIKGSTTSHGIPKWVQWGLPYMKMSENIHYLSVVQKVALARTGSGFSFQTDKPVT